MAEDVGFNAIQRYTVNKAAKSGSARSYSTRYLMRNTARKKAASCE